MFFKTQYKTTFVNLFFSEKLFELQALSNGTSVDIWGEEKEGKLVF